MKVWNKRDMTCPKTAVYVGRPSKWGNPYPLTDPLLPHVPKDEKRRLVIAEYRKYLLNNPALLAALPGLKGKDLVCWCAPLPCHADVLMELANSLAQPSLSDGLKENEK